MDRIFIEIGPKPIYWYGVMMASAFLSCMYIWSWLAVKEGRPKDTGSTIAFWVMLAGIIGARVGFIISSWEDVYANAPMDVFKIWEGGLIFYGGLIGASLAITAVALRGKEKLLSYFDLAIAAVPFGHALGRIGCYLNGCCFGSPWNGFCAVSYPVESYPYEYHRDHLHILTPSQLGSGSAFVHPVQLYEAALNLVLFAFFWHLFPRRKKDGTILALYLMAYGVIRFSMEYFRGDPRNPALAPGKTFMGLEHLDVAQMISLILFSAGMAIWFFLRTPREPNPSNT